MDVSIIIVSYNTKDLTIQTIQSVVDTVNDHSYEIIVVDNDSRDGSPEAIEERFPSTVSVIAQKTNLGFAQANNVGIHRAKGKYVFLLNSDTIAQPKAIDELVHTAQAHPEYGILSGRLLNRDGSYQPQGGALPTLANIAAWWLWPIPGVIPGVDPYQNPYDPQSTQIETRGWVGGTAMLISAAVIEKVGLLDEKIFMYAEDVDVCLRVWKAGKKVGIVGNAAITHLGNASGSSAKALLGEVTGIVYLFSKYYSRKVPILKEIFVLGAALRYLLFGILGRSEDARSLYGRIITQIRKAS